MQLLYVFPIFFVAVNPWNVFLSSYILNFGNPLSIANQLAISQGWPLNGDWFYRHTSIKRSPLGNSSICYSPKGPYYPWALRVSSILFVAVLISAWGKTDQSETLAADSGSQFSPLNGFLGMSLGTLLDTLTETPNQTLRTLTRHLSLLQPYLTSKGLLKLSHKFYNPSKYALVTNISLLLLLLLLLLLHDRFCRWLRNDKHSVLQSRLNDHSISSCENYYFTFPLYVGGSRYSICWKWFLLKNNNYLCFLHAGGTDYTKAFTRAFDLFKGTSGGSGSSRQKVILFLTDGLPNDSKSTIIQTIQTKNAELNNEVVIMTYGMFSNLTILLNIANQELINPSLPRAPDVKVSNYKYILFDLSCDQ